MNDKLVVPARGEPDPSLFRRLATAFPGAVESSHMGAPDFRVNGRIFATLAYGAKGLGTLKLAPAEQSDFIADAPELFSPAPGGWGRMGMTLVRLDAPEAVLAGALFAAHHHVTAKQAGAKRLTKKRAAAASGLLRLQ